MTKPPALLADHLGISAPFPDEDRVGRHGDRSKTNGVVHRALNFDLPCSSTFRNGLALALFLGISLWNWRTLAALYQISDTQEHYSHLLLVPLVSAYVLYLQRATILASKEWSPLGGAMLLMVGLGWSWSLTGDMTPDQLSMSALAWVVACWGVFLLGYGVEATRQSVFGLAFLLWAVPLPESLLNAVIVFLQRNSAEAADMLFAILGVPVFREGFVFSLSNFTVQVAEECSGIRSFLSLVITVLLAGHLFLHSLWAKLSIVAIVIPLAIVKNAFRIVGLTLLANYVDPTYITNSVLHRSGGIPLFVLSLVVLFAFMWLFRRIEQRFGYGGPDVPGSGPHAS